MQRETELLQAIANAVFNIPTREDLDGPIVTLPPPTTRLPREKPLPVRRPPTAWETFDKTKGIKNRKKDKVVNVPEGILKIKQELDAEFGEDQTWGRGDANANANANANNIRPSIFPSHVQLSATSLPIPGTQSVQKKVGKHELESVAGKGMGSLEREQTDKVLNKLFSKHSHGIFDVNKHDGREKKRLRDYKYSSVLSKKALGLTEKSPTKCFLDKTNE
ncbi:hypothetical protein MKW98_007419 [Papaver atlanticum]|uniref:Ribosome biogenesis regulatory protein n=1 Tax=Papaver atlanticum TaxID=357466 RepID=A0AAD4XAX7_9MAGN|nr:hypothetical protein MKW98_007419 [Papaver atlanticum]